MFNYTNMDAFYLFRERERDMQFLAMIGKGFMGMDFFFFMASFASFSHHCDGDVGEKKSQRCS